MRPDTAFILAGGKGTRLKPLTDTVPKPLIQVQEKALLEHWFTLLKGHGITNVILSVGHMADQIKAHCGDGSKYGISITYVVEDEPLGTAGPLRLAKHLITGPFVMCNADNLMDLNVSAMIEHHAQNGALGTLALTEVEDPSAYGVAKLNGHKIEHFVEKPQKEDAPSRFINAGCYVLDPEVLNLVSEDGPCSIERDVFPKIAQTHKLHGFSFSGQWFDTGTPERYHKANTQWNGYS